MEEQINYKIGKVIDEKSITNDKGYTYRLVTIEFDDDTNESIVCFNKSLLWELNVSIEFEIAVDGRGKKITGFKGVLDGIYRKPTVPQDEAPKDYEPTFKPVSTPIVTPIKSNKTNTTELYTTIQGKFYVTQAGLLNEAHKKGIKSIITEMIQFENEKVAVVKSVVTMKDKTIYTGYGDATITNTKMKGALLRMAETRATNRALRLANNIGVCSVDELEL